MKRARFTEEQIIGILHEHDAVPSWLSRRQVMPFDLSIFPLHRYGIRD